MKLKEILGGCAFTLGLLAYSSIGSSYAHDMNNAYPSAALSQVTYSKRLVLTQEEYKERKRGLESLIDVFVKADKKDPRPSANIEDLAVELIGNPLITKPNLPPKYGYGLMTPSKRYVIFPRHIFMPMDLYLRKALEGEKFSTDNLSKIITIYNLDKSHEATFNFLRDNLNVRDNKGNIYPSNPHIYCSIPSLDIIVTKVESPKNTSPFKISIKKVEVGDILEFFNIGGRGDKYLSQATATVMAHSKSARIMYSKEYSRQIIFDVFWMNVIGRKGLSGSTLSKNDEFSGMVIGIAIPYNKPQNSARPSTKHLKNHELVATSAKNVATAVRWCANGGLKELDSSIIINSSSVVN